MVIILAGYMESDQDISGKDLLKSLKDKDRPEEKKIDQEKLKQVKEKIKSILPELKTEFKNEIPFSAIHERTQIPFELIQVIVLDLLMNKDILGFINDKSTSELSDDILMIREKRIIDSIEPEFRTG